MTRNQVSQDSVVIAVNQVAAHHFVIREAVSNGPRSHGFPVQRRPGDNFEAWWRDQLADEETAFIESHPDFLQSILERGASDGTWVDSDEVLGD